jgi:HSP20 family protein
MAEKSILPWKRDKQIESTRGQYLNDPLLAMRDEMNRLFDSFFSRTPASLLADWQGFESGMLPNIDFSETDQEYRIAAELPGVDEKDVELTLDHNVLRIKGHKQAEKEQKDRRYYRVERSYGSFSRDIALPGEVDDSKIEASFKKGVLEIVLPKKEDASGKVKRVKINAA